MTKKIQEPSENLPQKSRSSLLKSLLVSTLVLLTGSALTAVIFFTEPKASRVGATKETAMLVETARVHQGAYRPTISVMGTVKPAEDLILSPRVPGVVVKRSEAFTPGGYVKKGETLIQIERADYQNALKQKQSDLHRAIADLNIEMGRQTVAEKEYALLGESLPEKNRSLVLRKPQLNAAKAKVEAARTAVTQAELDLKRTRLKAPFDAHVLSRAVNVGSHVAPGDNLGRLVGVDTYWIETTVPISKLRWLSFPSTNTELGSPVRIRHQTAWRKGVYRQGNLFKLLGALEEETRMARVLVSITDPLGLNTDRDELREPLIIGTYVEVRIQAGTISDVTRIKREWVRKNDTVWVMREGKLDIRTVTLAFKDEQYAYIQTGLTENDMVITTNLSTVVAGAPLRVSDQSEATHRPPTQHKQNDHSFKDGGSP